VTYKRLVLAILVAVRDGNGYEKEHKMAAVNGSGKYAEVSVCPPSLKTVCSIPLDSSTT
jgi:hypothetical protein